MRISAESLPPENPRSLAKEVSSTALPNPTLHEESSRCHGICPSRGLQVIERASSSVVRIETCPFFEVAGPCGCRYFGELL